MELSLVNKLKQLPIEPTYVVTEKNADIVNSLHLLETNREIKPNKVNDLVKAIQEGLFIPPIIVSVDQFMNRLKRRVDSGKWEEPSEKNWFNSYIEVASLKR